MRKVRFLIDDMKFFKKAYRLSTQEIAGIFADMKSFRAIFTLYGEGTHVDKYKLTDYNGNLMSLNTLNMYEKDIILSDCYAYFEGRKFKNKEKMPCGVIGIEDKNIMDGWKCVRR